MKTREEIERELNAKKEILSFEDFKKELELILRQFLERLRSERLNIDVSHSLKELSEINSLKTAINKISQMEIPKEILVKQEITHSTDKVSHNFLWWYFAISSFITCIAIAIAMHFYSNTSKIVEKAQKESRLEERIQAQKDLYYALPKSSRKYLRDKYPQAFGDYK